MRNLHLERPDRGELGLAFSAPRCSRRSGDPDHMWFKVAGYGPEEAERGERIPMGCGFKPRKYRHDLLIPISH